MSLQPRGCCERSLDGFITVVMWIFSQSVRQHDSPTPGSLSLTISHWLTLPKLPPLSLCLSLSNKKRYRMWSLHKTEDCGADGRKLQRVHFMKYWKHWGSKSTGLHKTCCFLCSEFFVKIECTHCTGTLSWQWEKEDLWLCLYCSFFISVVTSTQPAT